MANQINVSLALNSTLVLTPEILNDFNLNSTDKLYIAFLLANGAEVGIDITVQEIASILRITLSAAAKVNNRLTEKGYITTIKKGTKRRRIILNKRKVV